MRTRIVLTLLVIPLMVVGFAGCSDSATTAKKPPAQTGPTAPGKNVTESQLKENKPQ